MKREILDHAGHILSRETTRTLCARALHARVTAELGVDFGFAPFLDALATRPERFTIVTERAPFRDTPTVPDADLVEALLERAGVLRSATVVLADAPPPDEPRSTSTDNVAGALAATLADAHAAVIELLALERDEVAMASGRVAVLELEELRRCAAGLGNGNSNSNSISISKLEQS